MSTPPRPRHATRRFLLAAVAITAALIGTVTYAYHVWPALENGSVNTRFALRHVPAPNDVVVVGIDDVTFSDLRLHWPFPRSEHAKAIDRLHAAGARAIVYDVQFTEPTTPRQDYALYRAVGRARGAILATTEVDASGHSNVLGGDQNLARVHAVAGSSNLPTDSGGLIRRYSYSTHGLKSLAVRTVEAVTGRDVPRSEFDHGSAFIDFRGPPRSIRSVSFSDVVNGRVNPRVFAGKIVVVGAVAPTLQDVHATATGGGDAMSGAEVQANAIWTALHGNPLRGAPFWMALLAIAIGAGVAPLAGLRLGMVKVALVAGAVAAGYAVLAQVLFDKGTIVPVSYPLAAWTFALAGTIAVGYLRTSAESTEVSARASMLELVVRRRTHQVREVQLEIVQRLAQAVESRDGDTGDHIHRMGHLCQRLGLAVGMSRADADLLRHASAMHDVGKIGIPDRVLLKPARLNIEEWKVMKSHTTRGAEILSGSEFPLVRTAEVIALTHHERWDGSGYPAGLKGEEIPLVGRICAVCDVFDALLFNRPYKEVWSVSAALEEIERGSGTHFDPRLAAAFLELAPALIAELGLDGQPPVFSEADAHSSAPLAPAAV